MKMLLTISLQILAASGTVPGQIDSVCRAYCQALAVQNGLVRFVDMVQPPRNLIIGRYVRSDQRLVPRSEAPIRDLRSRHGWRVVVSAFLNHEQGESALRLRFFDPSGALEMTYDVLSDLEQVDIGGLFGGSDEVFAITSDEEHAYNTRTEIWFLPNIGKPKTLLTLPGVYGRFSRAAAGKVPGVVVNRQTYDGLHADTKGTLEEFYVWSPEAKSLTLQAR
jgi:hypothetical protein